MVEHPVINKVRLNGIEMEIGEGERDFCAGFVNGLKCAEFKCARLGGIWIEILACVKYERIDIRLGLLNRFFFFVFATSLYALQLC